MTSAWMLRNVNIEIPVLFERNSGDISWHWTECMRCWYTVRDSEL